MKVSSRSSVVVRTRTLMVMASSMKGSLKCRPGEATWLNAPLRVITARSRSSTLNEALKAAMMAKSVAPPAKVHFT